MMKTRQRGAALPSVLGVTAVLGLMAASYVQTTRHSNLATRYSVESIRLSHLADAAIERAIADLSLEDSLLPQDGTPHEFAIGRQPVRIRIWDEKGKFDLNVVSPQALENLIQGTADDASIDIDVGAVVEAINEHRLEQRRNNETPFRSIYDLLRLPAINETIFEAISPYVTVSSFTPRVNAVKADERILRSLPGVSETDIQTALAAKENGQPVTMPSAAPWVTTAAGPFYRVLGEVALDSGQRNMRDVTVWIRSDSDPVIVAARPTY